VSVNMETGSSLPEDPNESKDQNAEFQRMSAERKAPPLPTKKRTRESDTETVRAAPQGNQSADREQKKKKKRKGKGIDLLGTGG
jgi:hypothetical protein